MKLSASGNFAVTRPESFHQRLDGKGEDVFFDFGPLGPIILLAILAVALNNAVSFSQQSHDRSR
jgi:hypothetical protein